MLKCLKPKNNQSLNRILMVLIKKKINLGSIWQTRDLLRACSCQNILTLCVEDGRHIARGGANSNANVKLLNCYSLIKQKTQF